MKDIDSDFDRTLALETDPHKRRDAQLAILLAHARMTSQQLAEHLVTRREMERRMAEMERAMRENTEITQEVRDVMASVRSGFKVLGWIGHGVRWMGYLATAAAAIYGLYLLIRHGGPKP